MEPNLGKRHDRNGRTGKLTCLIAVVASLILSIETAHCQVTTLQNLTVYEDAIYDPKIKTPLLYATDGTLGNANAMLAPAIADLDRNVALVLEFDDLLANYRQFRVKFIHCDANWQKSVLNDIEFTLEFNDYPLNDYTNSGAVKVPYYHYSFQIPKLKLPGNYVAVVYTDRRPNAVVLTKRFCYYQNRIRLNASGRMAVDNALYRTHQQIDFDIDFKNYDVVAPAEDFKVVIRQNRRWDKVLKNLRPSSLRMFENRVEYHLFDNTTTMPAGNEFRYFDGRSTFTAGNFVQAVQRSDDYNSLFVMPDGPRNRGAYMQSDDFDGGFIIDNRESGIGATEGDYLTVVFTLKMPELADEDVFVNGGFNDWRRGGFNKMTYMNDIEAYQASIVIKQGVINYNYGVLNRASGQWSEAELEGNFSETENDYEIFVYHRPPASRAELLVGYRLVEVNRRR